jgi:YebC/PmpR family DNA-binding regulatory protein
VLLEVLTDNRNRTTPEIRHLFSKHGGNLGETGCVAWLFSRRGSLLIPREGLEEDRLMELALEAGAEDFDAEDEDYFRLTTVAEELHTVKDYLEERGLTVEAAELVMEPSSTTRLEGSPASQMLRLMEAFEDHDDVQNVWANFDIDDRVLAGIP